MRLTTAESGPNNGVHFKPSPSNASTLSSVRRRFTNTNQCPPVGSAPMWLRTMADRPSNERRISVAWVQNQIGRYGKTPLHWAVLWQSPDAVELLLQHGANVHIKDNGGCVALDSAREWGYAEICDLLQTVGGAPAGPTVGQRSSKCWNRRWVDRCREWLNA